MLKPHHLAVMLLGLVPAGLALAPSEATTAPSDGVSCKIKAVPSGGGVRLEGIARTNKPVSGSYELKVTTGGGGGSSSTVQSGEFSARPGRESTLGKVSLALESGSFYSAVLTLTWSGGSTACEKRSASRA